MEKRLSIPCPYPGVRSFRPDEAHLFFGRHSSLDWLLERLATKRFVCITGASGQGKSSLVRAGLVPILQKAVSLPSHNDRLITLHRPWHIVDFRPGLHPIQMLAHALTSTLPSLSANADAAQAQLWRHPELIREWFSNSDIPPGQNLLFIIDQFEETFLASKEDREAFVELLLNSVEHDTGQIHLLMTMRSEFIGECAEHPRLTRAINEGQYLLPRMSRDELRQAIEMPAAVCNGQIEAPLVQKLLNDMSANADRLTLLQHILAGLWVTAVEQSPERPILRLSQYDAIGGGAADALSRHANEILAQIGSDAYYLAAKMFRALTTDLGGTGDRVGRRPTRVAHLAEIVGCNPKELFRIIDAFRAPAIGFLTPPGQMPLTPDTIIDISHESLVRRWSQLRQWAREEYDSAERYKEIEQRAIRWKQGHGALLEGLPLDLALQWRETEEPTPAWADR